MEILFKAVVDGAFVSFGYIFAKYAAGVSLYSFLHRMSVLRVILCVIVLSEYVILIYLCSKARYVSIKKKHINSENCNIELFSERKDDLDRLENYLSSVDVVGIHGGWGSGKTFLVDKFIEKYHDKYEVIKVEPLTCNLDRIDSYLFGQLESVLWRNRIYPRYSRRLQSMMGDENWFSRLHHIFLSNETSQITVFQGVCQDLDKMKRPVLLVYEDIDRISEENKDQISKLLDISEKLLSHNVKVIYEFNLNRMAELGFDRTYIEKYVPYTMNLTEVSDEKLIENAVKELNDRNGELDVRDFHFLFSPINTGYFFKKELGIDWDITMTMHNITPRQIKAFITEVNAAMGLFEFAKKEDRQTTIAFFFMKHFFNGIYMELDFKEDLIEEIKFAYQPENSDCPNYYTIMELVAIGLTAQGRGKPWQKTDPVDKDKEECLDPVLDDIKKIFIDAGGDGTAQANRNKLGLLFLLGYKIGDQQKVEELDALMKEDQYAEIKGRRRTNVWLNQEPEVLKRLEHNTKISHLIRNLHMNGKSEYTDEEAVADVFIKEVLYKEKVEWEKCWKTFNDKLYWSDFLKDNKTIFKIGGDNFAFLFRAIWIYFSKRPIPMKEKEDTLERALDFYFEYGEAVNELDFEKVVILIFCEIGSRKIFLKVLRYFDYLQIIGNMNHEKIYRSFLKKYTAYAYREGYLPEYESFWLDMLADKNEEVEAAYFAECLTSIMEQVNMQIKKGIFMPSIMEELELVRDFYNQNIKIIKTEGEVKQRRLQVKTSVHSVPHYKNEETYKKLKDYAVSGNEKIEEEEYKNLLNQNYAQEKINLREYVELLNKFISCEK